MKQKHIFLALAIIGICYTWYYNNQYFQTSENPSLANFFEIAQSNFPGKSFGADLTVVVIAFFVFYIPDAINLKIKYWGVLIPLTFLIAVAFTFPLYLYIRSVKLEKMEKLNA